MRAVDLRARRQLFRHRPPARPWGTRAVAVSDYFSPSEVQEERSESEVRADFPAHEMREAEAVRPAMSSSASRAIR